MVVLGLDTEGLNDEASESILKIIFLIVSVKVMHSLVISPFNKCYLLHVCCEPSPRNRAMNKTGNCSALKESLYVIEAGQH